MDDMTAIPIPDKWSDLTDDEKDAVAAQLLKAVADENGIPRGAPKTRKFKRSKS